jgi:hypothetical protein
MFKGGSICQNVRQKRLNLRGSISPESCIKTALKGGQFRRNGGSVCSGIGGQFKSEYTLIRLLYGTGLHIGKALALRNQDVNLIDNFLVVRDSKNGKQRMIPISDSLSAVCREYVHHRNALPLLISDESPFFMSLNGSPCSTGTVYEWF